MLGSGGIGQIIIQILRAAGVRVIAVSRSQENLALASQNGAALAVPLGAADAVDRIRAAAGADRDGAACVFDMVGTAETMKAAASFAMRCGRIIVVGEERDFPAIDTIQIAQRELEIVGSRNGGLQDAVDAMQMMSDGIIRPPVAKHFPLDQINDAMELLRSGKAHGRIIVDVHE